MLVPHSGRSAPPCPTVGSLQPLGGLPPWAQPPSVLVATAPEALLSCSGCCCLSEIEAKYDKKMKMLRDELDLRRKTEIHEVEERKNGQITTLMQRHEEAFTDIKNYYNDITLNNLALINSLKVPPGLPATLGAHPCL